MSDTRYPILTPEQDPRRSGMTVEQVAEMLAAIAFPDLVDVDDAAPADDAVPQWDADLGRYVPRVLGPGGGGGASGVVVNSCYTVDLDGIFDPEAPTTTTLTTRYALIGQALNPAWNGVWRGDSDGVTPAPMVRESDLPGVDGYIATLHLVSSLDEFGAPLSGGFILGHSQQTAETLEGSGWYIAARGAAGGAVDSVNGETGAVVLDAADVGAIAASEKGANSGVAELDSGGKVPSSQLPSYVDDILEFANSAALPGTGETGKIYVTLDNNLSYRWSGSAYVEVSKSLALGETSATAHRGDRGKTAYDHSQITTGNPHGTTPADIGAAPASHTHEYPASTFTYVTDGEGGYDIVGGPYVAGSARIFIGPDDPAAAGFTPADGDQWENTSG